MYVRACISIYLYIEICAHMHVCLSRCIDAYIYRYTTMHICANLCIYADRSPTSRHIQVYVYTCVYLLASSRRCIPATMSINVTTSPHICI